VALVTAGTAYGSIGADLDSTTTDGSGNFSITYVPPSPATLLYVIATGGNAGAGTNSAIALIGVVGLSNEAPGSVKINELTTVAGEWALAQFIDSSGTAIGAPSTNATGLANAANQAQVNLANVATGLPASFWTTYDANVGTCTLVECDVLEPSDALRNLLTDTGELPAPPINSSCVVLPSVVPPVNCDGLERLDTFANILAACVESASPSSTPCTTLLSDTDSSTTTLEAAHYLATNPGVTTNIADLYGLQAGSPPFTPALISAPDGWELALNLTPSGANFSDPYALALDASGNVWIADAAGSAIELTSSGALVNSYDPAGANFHSPEGIAIDDDGNVWIANTGTLANASVTELTSSGTLAGNYNNTNTSGANFSDPISVAIDASGDAWIANFFPAPGSITALSSAGALVGNYNPSGSHINEPLAVAVDASGDIWVTSSNSGYTTKLTSGGTLLASTNDAGDILSPAGIAIDASGNAWVADQSGGQDASGALDCIAANVGSATINDNSGLGTSNFSEPYGIAVDSSDNIWVTNAASNGVTELTPTTGGNVTVAGYYAPAGGNFNTTYSVAIDPSGNVWAANSGSASVAEIIGAAGPVLTPLEACLTQASPAAVCLP
jgi:streptogramin lyase